MLTWDDFYDSGWSGFAVVRYDCSPTLSRLQPRWKDVFTVSQDGMGQVWRCSLAVWRVEDDGCSTGCGCLYCRITNCRERIEVR